MKRTAMGFAAATALLILAPGGASAYEAKVSASGADYTMNTTAGTSLKICDGEKDGHDVAGEYVLNNQSNVSVQFVETDNTCRTPYTGLMYRHRVVELVPGALDDYGPWKTLW